MAKIKTSYLPACPVNPRARAVESSSEISPCSEAKSVAELVRSLIELNDYLEKRIQEILRFAYTGSSQSVINGTAENETEADSKSATATINGIFDECIRTVDQDPLSYLLSQRIKRKCMGLPTLIDKSAVYINL